MPITKELVAYISCGVLAVTVVALVIYIVSNKNKTEPFSAAQKLQMAARYAKQPNMLMPTEKAKPATNQILLPLNTGERGDVPMSYLLPTNGVEKDVAEPATADVAAAPPVIGGTETTPAPAEANGVALNVTTEDAIKAGANSIATTDFHDQSIPDTSSLPAVVQNGVIDEPAKEGFCGGNTRVCPQFMKNSQYLVQHKLQKGGISTNKEGFRPSKRWN